MFIENEFINEVNVYASLRVLRFMVMYVRLVVVCRAVGSVDFIATDFNPLEGCPPRELIGRDEG